MTAPVLHILCGKIASGKSTLAARLHRSEGGLLVAEDDWLAALYGDEMRTGQDYLRCVARLREVLGPHLEAVLGAGLSVVLDTAANTAETRAWMAGIAARAGARLTLHVLDTPDAVCLARLKARNAAGTHQFGPSDEMFHRFSRHYAPPGPGEPGTVIRHRPPRE